MKDVRESEDILPHLYIPYFSLKVPCCPINSALMHINSDNNIYICYNIVTIK